MAGTAGPPVPSHSRDNLFIRGASVVTGQNGVVVEDNQFLGAPADKTAIYTVGGPVDGVFSGNTITGYGVGLDLGDREGPRTVADNTVIGAGIGIHIEGEIGLGTITGNRVVGNSGDGILVSPETFFFQGTISGNVALGNGGNGIEVQELQSPDGATVTFTGNVAKGNVGHGIVAPSGAVDGGGNQASGNRTDPQGVNLVCSN